MSDVVVVRNAIGIDEDDDIVIMPSCYAAHYGHPRAGVNFHGSSLWASACWCQLSCAQKAP